MSTNSNCEFHQIKPDQWYYVLEDTYAPQNAWDWRENAAAYGPFATQDLANTHLDRNHANPGGSCTYELEKGQLEVDLTKDSTLQQLIANAISPKPKMLTNSFGRGYGGGSFRNYGRY